MQAKMLLPYLFDYKPSDFCTKLNWKLVKSLWHDDRSRITLKERVIAIV